MKAAQRSLLRAYRKHQVVIEIELGKTKHYPAFQFRDGKIIDALTEINKTFATAYADTDTNTTRRGVAGLVADTALWITERPGRLGSIAERPAVFSLRAGFELEVEVTNATSSFVAPRWMTS